MILAWDDQHKKVAVNPARAGMIPDRQEVRVRGGRKPRASGDDPAPINWEREQ